MGSSINGTHSTDAQNLVDSVAVVEKLSDQRVFGENGRHAQLNGLEAHAVFDAKVEPVIAKISGASESQHSQDGGTENQQGCSTSSCCSCDGAFTSSDRLVSFDQRTH